MSQAAARPAPWQAKLRFLLGLVAVMAALALIDLLLGADLHRWGVWPREWIGLPGILAAPFLHGNLFHLLTNAVPLLVLAWLILIRGWRDFVAVSLVTMLTSGGAAWLLGKPGTVHIGSSGVVFGYFGFLVARGFFERTLSSMLIAVVVGLLYGGLLWNLFPLRDGVSWESHVGGFIGGIACGYGLARPRSASRNS